MNKHTKIDKIGFVNTFCMFWNEDGILAFRNFGFSRVANEKQTQALINLGEKLTEIVKKETEKINKLK